jgi:hypothetical protein
VKLVSMNSVHTVDIGGRSARSDCDLRTLSSLVAAISVGEDQISQVGLRLVGEDPLPRRQLHVGGDQIRQVGLRLLSSAFFRSVDFCVMGLTRSAPPATCRLRREWQSQQSEETRSARWDCDSSTPTTNITCTPGRRRPDQSSGIATAPGPTREHGTDR